MSDGPVFSSSMQNAIFQFSMSLISQYRKTLDPVPAAEKCADWLESLAAKIRENAQQYSSTIDEQLADYQSNVKED